MSDDPHKMTFSTAAVAQSAGVLRPTLDAWLLRGYLPLKPGPGTGRVREFSFLDSVRIAAVAELTRLGMNTSSAGRICGNITELQLKPHFDARWALFLATSQVSDDKSERRVPAFAIASFDGVGAIMRTLQRMLPNASPSSFIMVDLTAIVRRIEAALKNGWPTSARTWLD